MRKSKHHEYRQAYNAQATVDAEGSQLILGAGIGPGAEGARRGQSPSDRNELVGNIASIPVELGRPETVLADNGYTNGDEVASLAEIDVEALVATGAEGRQRRYDFRPPKAGAAPKEPKAEWLKAMAEKLASEEGRALYKLRQQTVEPVFGIIKAVLGFRRFSMRGLDKVTRGLDKVTREWDLVALVYNCKRLHKLKREMAS